MKLRFIWITTLFLMSGWGIKAQNELFSRQYFLNNYLVNPAVAGVFDYADFRLGYSRQWTQVDNAPSSLLLTFHTNLAKNKDQVMRYSYQDRKYQLGKRGLQSMDRRLKHGLGVRLTYDKVHVFTNAGGALSYACHVPISPYWTISVGLSGGCVFSNMDVAGIYIADLDDPLLQGDRHELIPLVEAGIWVYSSALYVGGSVSKLMSNPYDTDGTSDYMNIYLTAGYQWQMTDFIHFIPSVMYRLNGYSDAIVDVNARLTFYDLIWAGVSLRDLINPSLHIGVEFGQWAEIYYTYDVNKKVMGASHEIGVGYKLWGRAQECKNKWYFR